MEGRWRETVIHLAAGNMAIGSLTVERSEKFTVADMISGQRGREKSKEHGSPAEIEEWRTLGLW